MLLLKHTLHTRLHTRFHSRKEINRLAKLCIIIGILRGRKFPFIIGKFIILLRDDIHVRQ